MSHTRESSSATTSNVVARVVVCHALTRAARTEVFSRAVPFLKSDSYVVAGYRCSDSFDIYCYKMTVLVQIRSASGKVACVWGGSICTGSSRPSAGRRSVHLSRCVGLGIEAGHREF